MNEDFGTASLEQSHADTHSAMEGEGGRLEEALNDKQIRKLLDEEQVHELYDVFNMFDTDGSGAIDVKELK